MMHELSSWSDYVSGELLSFWRSTSGFEVDFIIGDHTAIEVKAKETVSAQDIKSLRALRQEKKLKHFVCVCMEKRSREVDGIKILPYAEFINALWDGRFK